MKTIGVFFGGKSPEHDISILTGQLIISGLRDLGHFNVVPIYISKDGRWFMGEGLGSIQVFQKQMYDMRKFREYVLDLNASRGILIFRKKGIAHKKISIDVAFPAFHGRNGEDGTIQGLFEMFDIPYVGCDVVSSAIAMDKVLTKLLYQRHALPTVDFVFFEKTQWEKEKQAIMAGIMEKLRWPIFVKPARLGSSIGIAKTKNQKDLEFAIEVALHYDNKVLAENGVENLMDITCAVLGTTTLTPSLLQESVFNSGFFSYEDKYLKAGGVQLGKAENNIVIPARVDAATTQKIQAMAMEAFKILGCSGIARVDFLFDTVKKDIYINEVNTLPGTLYHHLWKKTGIELPELLSRLVDYAQEERKNKDGYISIFESNVLNQADWSQKLYFKGIEKK